MPKFGFIGGSPVRYVSYYRDFQSPVSPELAPNCRRWGSDMSTAVACPTCTTVDVRPVLSVSAVQAADSIVLPSGDFERNRRLASHIRSLWGTDDCRILQCTNCGFGFSWPYVASAARSTPP